jgi:hypothetical protein
MRYRYGMQVVRSAKKTGTVAIEIGDMIKFTSGGKVTPCTASADANDIVGIALSASPATDLTATTVRYDEIGHGSVYMATVASATHMFGEGYVITGDQTLGTYGGSSLYATATNVVAYCVKDVDTAGTSVLVTFKPGRFQREIRQA